MTEVEKLEAEERAIKNRLASARARETDDSLRDSFRKLAADDSLPVGQIVSEALSGGTTGHSIALVSFAERLAHSISVNTPRS